MRLRVDDLLLLSVQEVLGSVESIQLVTENTLVFNQQSSVASRNLFVELEGGSVILLVVRDLSGELLIVDLHVSRVNVNIHGVQGDALGGLLD